MLMYGGKMDLFLNENAMCEEYRTSRRAGERQLRETILTTCEMDND